jgi:nitrite reductase/ring-hydroxylating ferredoxin subunit
MRFTIVASSDELLPGAVLGRTVRGVPVLLCWQDGRILAYEDRCAHQGVRLSEGLLVGSRLTCPAHGWCYELRTGVGINPRTARLQALPVRSEGGWILVDVGERPTGGGASRQVPGGGGAGPGRGAVAPVGTAPRCPLPPGDRQPAAPGAAGLVGPVLLVGREADAIVAALRQERPELTVLHRGAYLRVQAVSPCRLRRAAVEQLLGRRFLLPADLERVMPSFCGRMRIDGSAVVWEEERRP